MLINFLIAGITGVVVGSVFTVRALIAGSVLLLVYAIYVAHAWSALKAIAVTFALVATMQAGYILGLVLSSFAHKIVVCRLKSGACRSGQTRDHL